LGSGLAHQSIALDAFRRSGIQSDLLGLLHWIRALRDDPFALCGYRLVANWRFAKGIVVGDVARYLGPGGLLCHRDNFEFQNFFIVPVIFSGAIAVCLILAAWVAN
jgi:hypothetical protein